MPAETKNAENKTVQIQATAHKKASLASSLTNKTLNDFISEAVDKVADPILKKHGLNPSKLEPIANAA